MNAIETVERIVAEFSADRTAYLVRSHDEPETRRGWGAWVIEGNIKPDPRPGSDHAPPRRGTRKLRGGVPIPGSRSAVRPAPMNAISPALRPSCPCTWRAKASA